MIIVMFAPFSPFRSKHDIRIPIIIAVEYIVTDKAMYFPLLYKYFM